MFENITQIIPTIQGEGPKVGVPSLLIRWKACNLECPFCDTQWSNKHTGDELSWDTIKNYLTEYPTIKNIMFTGGEPFIYADKIAELLDKINDEFEQIKTIEIETNGTLITEKLLEPLFHFTVTGLFKITLNISPKLGSECYRERKTPKSILEMYKSKLKILNTLGKETGLDYIFKIVYDPKWKKYILDFLSQVKPIKDRRISCDNIFVMPITPDFRDYSVRGENAFIHDFRKSCNDAVEFCLDHGVRFSCREHVWVWFDKKNELIEANA